jgi:hypothetical protein
MARYQEAYHALFQRIPSELRDLGNNWVQVNGARMSLQELEQLTLQLQRELREKEKASKRSLVQRLVKWLTST